MQHSGKENGMEIFYIFALYTLVSVHMKKLRKFHLNYEYFFFNTAGHEAVWHGHVVILFSSYHEENECIAKCESSLSSDESQQDTTPWLSLKRRRMDGMYFSLPERKYS